MKTKLVTDCSANICGNIRCDISYVPLKIVTNEKEYIDTPELDVPLMLSELKAYKGTSGTACWKNSSGVLRQRYFNHLQPRALLLLR